MMEAYKQEFVDFMLDCGVLKFGDFTLKSGRKSPFFMNAGLYVTGTQLTKLGEYYAKAIHDKYGDDFDVLFGPAYKGIPLSVATTMAYSRLYGKEIRYCSHRKEAKDHGDAGLLLGSPIKDGDRIVVGSRRGDSPIKCDLIFTGNGINGRRYDIDYYEIIIEKKEFKRILSSLQRPNSG